MAALIRELEGTPSLTRLLTGLASVVIILAGLKAAAGILSAPLLALFVVLVAAPGLRWLRGRGMPAGTATAVVIATVVIGTLALLAFLGVSMAQLALAVPTYKEEAARQLDSLEATLAAGGINASAVRTVAVENLDRAVQLALALLAGLVGILANVGWMLYLFVFMMVEVASFPAQLRLGLGGDSPTLERVTRFARSLSDFISIKAWLGFLAAARDVVLLTVLGVDFALLWGVLSFFLSFIPSLGFLLALIPPMLVALLQHGPGTALVVLLGYWLINGVVDSVIGPRMLGQSLEVSTIVAILALVLWGYILGGIGALLALPIMVLIKMVLLERYPEAQWLGTAISNPPRRQTASSGDRTASGGPAEATVLPAARAVPRPEAEWAQRSGC